ncbi:proline-rich protein HaeIII subfamily 1-like [Strigops habroptila]|uniref:proline-rich protein HaeIII subfamily 1-like n=1 Tax=Strigops habroptila TaxID=2489341 RepID=UPI0011CF6E1B|nr:proline-rich protein HaeIII subfamily 1-like [Strigops habroptila]
MPVPRSALFPGLPIKRSPPRPGMLVPGSPRCRWLQHPGMPVPRSPPAPVPVPGSPRYRSPAPRRRSPASAPLPPQRARPARSRGALRGRRRRQKLRGAEGGSPWSRPPCRPSRGCRPPARPPGAAGWEREGEAGPRPIPQRHGVAGAARSPRAGPRDLCRDAPGGSPPRLPGEAHRCPLRKQCCGGPRNQSQEWVQPP